MPFIIRPRRARHIAAAVFSSLLAMAAIPAMASAYGSSCPTLTGSTVFAQFGDSSHYSLLQGGSFENGAAGWSLTNASVASGNESYNVDGGSHSLAIQANGVAVSPPFCVNVSEPWFRFFARQTSSGSSFYGLNTAIRWTDVYGFTHDTQVGQINPNGSWRPSGVLRLATALPLWMPGATLTVQLVFQPADWSGAWAIDDVFIDPYSR